MIGTFSFVERITVKKPKRRKVVMDAHYEAYNCSRCGECYVCSHKLAYKAKAEAGSIFWWTCRDGFSKPSYFDHGQFVGLRGVSTGKEVEWEEYG